MLCARALRRSTSLTLGERADTRTDTAFTAFWMVRTKLGTVFFIPSECASAARRLERDRRTAIHSQRRHAHPRSPYRLSSTQARAPKTVCGLANRRGRMEFFRHYWRRAKQKEWSCGWRSECSDSAEVTGIPPADWTMAFGQSRGRPNAPAVKESPWDHAVPNRVPLRRDPAILPDPLAPR